MWIAVQICLIILELQFFEIRNIEITQIVSFVSNLFIKLIILTKKYLNKLKNQLIK